MNMSFENTKVARLIALGVTARQHPMVDPNKPAATTTPVKAASPEQRQFACPLGCANRHACTAQEMGPVMIKLKTVQTITCLGRSSVYARINPNNPSYDPSFPKPIRLSTGSGRAIAWVASEVSDYLASRITESRIGGHNE